MARIDADGDRDARAEGAVFEAVRVPGARQSTWVAVIVAAALGGLVVIGAVGAGAQRAAVPEGDVARAGSDAPGAGVVAPTATAAPPRPSREPSSAETGSPSGSPSGPASLVVLDLRPVGSHLFVHGDVFSIAVDAVSVALVDSEGAVAARERVHLPGGSRSLWTDPNLRFDVQFAVPDEMMGDGLSVEVTAFDLGGTRVAIVRAPVTSPLVPF
jgi:hypothetical protein